MKQKQAFLAGEADAYFSRNVHRPRDEILKFIEPEGDVLEVGCASGANLGWIGSGWGIDPSSKAITEGQRLHPHLCLKIGTADSIPFNRDFDTVLYGFCLYLVDRELLPQVVSEAMRVLRPGGKLGIWDFHCVESEQRPYHHRDGLWSYKMDYSTLFPFTLERKQLFDDGLIAAWVMRR